MPRTKSESSKTSTTDKSYTKKSKTEASSPRIFRKSPARTASTKSPSRAANKSPASPIRRNPPRSSPARTSPSRKSPSRKSPTRRSSVSRESSSRKGSTSDRRSPGRLLKVVLSEPDKNVTNTGMLGRLRKRNVIVVDSDSDSDLLYNPYVEKPQATVRGRTRRLNSDYDYIPSSDVQIVKEVTPVARELSSRYNIGVNRRSAEKMRSNESDRIVHLKHYESTIEKLAALSDEEDLLVTRSSSVKTKSKSQSRSSSKPIEMPAIATEFGGWIGALFLTFTTPLCLIGLHVFCNEAQCSFSNIPNFDKFKYSSTYISLRTFLIYLGYVSLLAALGSLPFGGKKVTGLPNKHGKLNYVMNGLFVAFIIGTILIFLEYFNFHVGAFILQKYFQFVISSLITGCLFATYLYARSFFVPISALNPFAISNSKIYNYWIGRELNPRIFNKIDVKLLLMRNLIIGIILINAILVYKSVNVPKLTAMDIVEDIKSINVNTTLLILAGLQIFYALDFLIFESAFVTTFDVQYEGVGYMTSLLGFCGPFFSTIVTKYVYDHQIKLPKVQLIVAVVIFVVGYVLYRGSNLQKNAFRQNPYSPALSHLESIPTSQGKKLLVSGYWGFVRHPNYLGDILMMISFALFALNSPACIAYIADILFLVHRAHRDGKRCKQRYGTAWERYCKRVKYVLVPEIY